MLTILKISDTHEWRLQGSTWGLHYLPSEDADIPLRVAARFEAEVLNAAKEAVEIREAVVAELVRLKTIKERMEIDDARPVPMQMSRTEYSSLRRDYERGKGFAWARAKSLVAGVAPCDCAKRLAGRVTGNAHLEGCPNFVAPLTHEPATPGLVEPAPTKWGIDHSTGRPILVYENCSVIEGKQAQYILNLIQRTAGVTVADGQTFPRQSPMDR